MRSFTTLAALLLPSLALAQDAPWDTPEAGRGEATEEAPAEELPADDADEAGAAAEPNVTVSEEDATPAPLPSARPSAVPEPPTSYSAGNALAGYRIRQIDHGSGVSVGQELVVGVDGGTFATHFGARARFDDVLVQVSMPFAAHRTPAGRQVGLGNLRLGVAYALDSGDLVHTIGVEGTIAAGAAAYTWVNDAYSIWPSNGGAAVWQFRYGGLEPVTLIGRVSAGVYAPRSYAPYPGLVFTASGTIGVDYGLLDDRVGIVGETTVSYWDTSPWELAALVRVDPFEGWRVRGGFVLPFAVWADWDPSSSLPGAAEATLFLDTSIAF